ncbi:MAG: FapA family protein [Lachnospiraceae bacterium]|nr:FapA family protein [Lachnospiraceae bacterium]
MEQMNAYFCLDVQEFGTAIRIFPPKEGGERLDIREVTTYLERHGCDAYNLKELNLAISGDEESSVPVGDIHPNFINEEMEITISPNNMEAVCRFYPATENGSKINVQEILKSLTAKGVIAGVDQDEILKFMEERRYCTDYIMAKGIPPVEGHDARIEYYFNTDVNLRPKKNEDGSVNYHQLNVISHVELGQLIAKLFPEDRGKPGKTIRGGELKPAAVKSLQLAYGDHIKISEDKTELYSDVTGHAMLVNGKVFVSDVYEVPADVDNSTGDIDYSGNVVIKGNVKGGFTVRAKGNVIVDGVVEDAVIEAEGQIIVKRGIHGMTKGLLKAKGNILCKFIENALVISGGSIETDCILHSKVYASYEIRVSGKKGFITGGVIRAGNLVEAQTIGSSMGAITRIEVGVEPQKKARYVKLQKEIAEAEKTLEQIGTILTTYRGKMKNGERLSNEKLAYVTQLTRAQLEKEKELAPVKEEYEVLHNEMTQERSARVKVTRTVYAGTIITISDASMTLKTDRSFCQIVKNEGELEIQNM